MKTTSTILVTAALALGAHPGLAAQHDQHDRHEVQRHEMHHEVMGEHEASMFLQHLQDAMDLSSETVASIEPNIIKMTEAVMELRALHGMEGETSAEDQARREAATKVLNEERERIVSQLDEEHRDTFNRTLHEHLQHLLPGRHRG